MNNPLFTTEYSGKSNVKYTIEYYESDSFEHLPKDRVKQAYGVCFVGDQMVIGFGGLKKGWGLIGGSVEPGETFEQTLIREIKEESNMEVISSLPIGYQKLTNTENGKLIFQLRYVCKVKPLGEFVIDEGDGLTEKGITEIKLINPDEYRKYFDWGEIGECIIKRAVDIKNEIV